jgi:uncharacterized protein with PIN domain
MTKRKRRLSIPKGCKLVRVSKSEAKAVLGDELKSDEKYFGKFKSAKGLWCGDHWEYIDVKFAKTEKRYVFDY